MRNIALSTALAALIAGPALAQIGNPAGVAPDTPQSAPGVPAPHQTNAQDELFVQLLAAGGMAEVALGRLAGQKAKNRAVKEFGRLMVEDHGKANEKLAGLAKAARINLPE